MVCLILIVLHFLYQLKYTSMSVISSSVLINASAERVFKVITNPKEVVTFIPGAMRVTNVPQLPIKRGDVVSWEFLLLGLPLKGKWVVDEVTSPNVYIAQMKGSVEGQLTYSILPKGKFSKLTIDFDYKLPDALIKRYTLRLIEPHAQGIINNYLSSLKTYLELPLKTVR